MTLSILCVTKGEERAYPFLSAMVALASTLRAEMVIAVDTLHGACDSIERRYGVVARVVRVGSLGFLESALDVAVYACNGDYILRLDDDERCSPAMAVWLFQESYLTSDHWKFPRLHLWPSEDSVVITPHLWPDHQTRLSVKGKSAGRTSVHAGSPFGGGLDAHVCIEHHKFLTRSREDRLSIALEYDKQWPGSGTGGMKPFSLPEDVYETVMTVAKGDGSVPWEPAWEKAVDMRGAA